MNYYSKGLIRVIAFLLLLLKVNNFNAQTHLSGDPFNLLLLEKSQFQGKTPFQSNIFRPIFLQSDSLAISINYKSEFYFNDNAPNQENMDVRYFSKGFGTFNSLMFSLNSPYFSFLFEP